MVDDSKLAPPSLQEVVRTVVVVAIAVIIFMAGRGEHCMLMVFIRVHVVLIVELVVKLGMRHVIGLLFVNIVLVGLGVVSLAVVGVVMGHLMVHWLVVVVAIPAIVVVARIAVVGVMRVAMIVITVAAVVMSVLIWRGLTSNVMCSDDAVLVALVVVLAIVVGVDPDSSLMVMIAVHRLVHGVLMVVVGLNVVSVVEFMVKLGVCDVVGLLLVDRVAVGLRVVSLVVVIVVAAMVTMVCATVVTLMRIVVGILVAHVRAMVRPCVEVVVGVLVGRRLAVDVMSSDDAVLLLSLRVAVSVAALLMIRVVVVVARHGVIDRMLVVLVRMHVVLIVVRVVERVVRLVISGDVRVITMLAAVAVEIALIRVIVRLQELNDRHVDVLGAHSVGLIDSGSTRRVQVLGHGDSILGLVEELGDRDLVLGHEGLHSLAVEEEVSDGRLHELGHGDVVGGEVLGDRRLVRCQEFGDGHVEELSN